MNTIPVASLKPNDRNPRTITPAALAKLAESIERDPTFMALRPIIIDGQGVILGGNQRFAACKKLGMTELPASWVRTAEGLTDEQQKRFVLVDNAPEGMAGEWDLDRLLADWQVPELGDLGFDMADLAASLPTGEEVDAEPQTDRAEELRSEWGVEAGQLWALGDHRLLCGDSMKAEDVARLMGGAEIASVVTDPPYGMEFRSNHRKTKHKTISGDASTDCLTHAVEIKASHSAYVWCRWDNVPDVPRPRSLITWVKNNWSMGDLEHEHARQTEVCLFYSGESHSWPDKRPADVVNHARTGNNLHPTQKPVSLMAEVVGWTAGIIYDPFLGSGTTLIAAEQLGRKCYGMEISPAYCAVVLQRFKDATGKTPTLVAP